MIPADRAQAYTQLSQCRDVLELAFVGLDIDEFLQKHADCINGDAGIISYECYIQGIRPVEEGEALNPSGEDGEDEDEDVVSFNDLITFIFYKLNKLLPELIAIMADLKTKGVAPGMSKLTYANLVVNLLPLAEGENLDSVPVVMWPHFWLTNRMSVADGKSRNQISGFADFLRAIRDTIDYSRAG